MPVVTPQGTHTCTSVFTVTDCTDRRQSAVVAVTTAAVGAGDDVVGVVVVVATAAHDDGDNDFLLRMFKKMGLQTLRCENEELFQLRILSAAVRECHENGRKCNSWIT